MKFVSKHSYSLLAILLVSIGMGAAWAFPSIPSLIARNITAIFVVPTATPLSSVEHVTAGATITPFKPLAVYGGTMPYIYEVTSGVLPAGMQLDLQTGMVSGTPESIGRHQTVTITVRDANNAVAATRGNLTFVVSAPPVAKAQPSVQPLAKGVAVKPFKPLEAIGGTGAHVYSVVEGQLPEGLMLDAQTGVISGVPSTTYRQSAIVVGVRDVNNVSANQTSRVTFTTQSSSLAKRVPVKRELQVIARVVKKAPVKSVQIAKVVRSTEKVVAANETPKKTSQNLEKSVVVSLVPNNLLLPQWANNVFVMEVTAADLERAKHMSASVKSVAQEVRQVAEETVQSPVRSTVVKPIRASNDVMTAADEVIASPVENEPFKPQSPVVEIHYPSADVDGTPAASDAPSQVYLSSLSSLSLADCSSASSSIAYSLN